MLGHGAHQRLRRGGAHLVVDVEAVGIAADGDHFRAELVEHARRHAVAGAVRGVDDDLEALERKILRERALAELQVAPGGIVQAARLAQRSRVGPLRRLGQRGLDVHLPLVG
jgi:hypothetical protein